MPKRLQTWQIWHAMRKTIGDRFIMDVLGRSNARTIRMYAQDPRCTVDRSKDPIEALAILFDELETCGRGDIAKLAIKHLQRSVGCDEDLHCPDQLKDTIDAGKSIEEVHIFLTDAVHEIERTYTEYCHEVNNAR